MSYWILILLTLILTSSLFTILKYREMAWVLIRGIAFILFNVVGYWLFTPEEHTRYFGNLSTKWFGSSGKEKE